MGWAPAGGFSRSWSATPAATARPLARLDTNRLLVEAIAMYRSAGYVEVPSFNDEYFAHHWFRKEL